MLDIKWLREAVKTDGKSLVDVFKRRGYEFDLSAFQTLEDQRKHVQMQVQDLQNKKNQTAKMVGQAKARGEDVQTVLAEVKDVGSELKNAEEELNACLAQLDTMLSYMPNLPHESVPHGATEDDNREEKTWGSIPAFDFEPQDHTSLGEALKQVDFAIAGEMSGSRFAVLTGGLARLHRALAQFMLDLHTQEHGYTEVNVPLLVRPEALYGTGQLPKFGEDLFHVAGDWDLSLIPTAEVPLANLVKDSIQSAENLPLCFVAHTPCFRSEAGSYGKDTRGLIRLHQFEKVEMVQVVRPEDSYATLDQMCLHAETVLQKLELPYRVVTLCEGDMGFGAAKTYDLEVWLPSQNTYREISSCSNCESFQARRLKARWRAGSQQKPEWLHTLNGSGVAVGRALVAVMENYQDASGNILIPEVLQPYMGGLKIISL